MRLLMRSLLTLFAFLFLFGCAAKQMSKPASFAPVNFDKAAYTSKVDNFLIVFDASSSMRYPLNQETKFNKAQALVNRLNLTLPELGQTAGLRSFGHSPKVSKKTTELFYGMEKYSTANLDKNFKKIFEPGGLTPLGRGLNAAQADFKGLSGESNAVIIITDGEDLSGDVLPSAKALKKLYGSSICFYPILVGDAPAGAAALKQIASIGGCGFYSTADQLLKSPAAMADFVEKVFLKKKPAIVAPAPVVVPKKEKKVWVLDNVLFGSGSAVIKPGAYYVLDDIIKTLGENPAMNINIQGHTDNVGSPEKNKDLSLRRAQAVKNYLVGKGIMPGRMTTEGLGCSQPIALNGTEAGRALNRRVEVRPF